MIYFLICIYLYGVIEEMRVWVILLIIYYVGFLYYIIKLY